MREQLEIGLIVVRESRALLNAPTRWLQNAFARDHRRRVCLPTDPAASRWCLTAALLKSGSSFDGAPLRYVGEQTSPELVVDNFAATPSGRLTTYLVGAFLAACLERANLGRQVGERFLFAPRLGYEPSELHLCLLPQFVNDLPAMDWQTIDLLLARIERALMVVVLDELEELSRSSSGQA